MGKRRLVIGFVLLMFVLLITAIVLYIRPAKSLDLHYSAVSWKDKLRGMAESRRPELTLTEQELNHLSKKELRQYIAEHELPVRITGADFQLNGDRLTADVNASWGAIDVGVKADYLMEYASGRLLLVPEKLAIRELMFPPERFGLEPIEIDLGIYLPDVVKVKEMSFPGKTIKVEFTLDWLEVARYLDLL
ncbi:hypothetical protein DFP94_11946 [Fontibacillus phaseoli]|uniref:DUF2140 family protein n=1 Tax=Fontibacillus phaseoli TaxID=1416533 RepID=A0A369AXW8_9BACL|nr:hypothetical protein [Fontibacillus phaseoli]RCX13935.1 hypothetical protein DFP94_11946 [Fontibacillus phaseoli]